MAGIGAGAPSWLTDRIPRKFWDTEDPGYNSVCNAWEACKLRGIAGEKMLFKTLAKNETTFRAAFVGCDAEMVDCLWNGRLVIQTTELCKVSIVESAAKQKECSKRARDKVIKGENDFTIAVRGSEMPQEEMRMGLDRLKVARIEASADSTVTKRNLIKSIASDEQMTQAAILEMRLDFFSSRTIDSYSSEVALYGMAMEEMGVAPWPVCTDNLQRFGAMLKAAGYRGGDAYISAVMTTARLMGQEIDQDLMTVRSKIGKSLRRGIGEAHHMKPITACMLSKICNRLVATGAKNGDQFGVLVFNLMVVTLFFMLRIEESVSMSKKDVLECTGKYGMAKIQICVDKCNQEEKMVTRSLLCICDKLVTPSHPGLCLCPVCALEWLKGSSAGSTLSSGKLHKPLAYDGMLRKIRDLLEDIDVQVKENDRFAYGTHSLRRGGAQSLARGGWTISMIQRWGRWKSDAVWVYIQESCMEVEWRSVGLTIMGSGIAKEDALLAIEDDSFHPAKPSDGDQISFFSNAQNRWIRGKIVLCPGQVRPRKWAAQVPVWPIGATVFGISWMNINGSSDESIQTVALDASTRWNIVGDIRKKVVKTRAGRVVIQ